MMVRVSRRIHKMLLKTSGLVALCVVCVAICGAAVPTGPGEPDGDRVWGAFRETYGELHDLLTKV